MHDSDLNKSVSVIIPVYNAERFLRNCLDSVLAQTYCYIEIILVDDGSTDESAEICDGYAVQDSRVKVFHIINSGANAARRFGVEHATGEYVYFVDADDTIASDTIESALSLSTDNVDIVSMEENEDLVCSAEQYGSRLLHWNAVHVWGKLFRKELLADEWVFDIPRDIIIAEDLLMNLRSVRNMKGVAVISSLHKYNYRIVQGSVAHSVRITPEYDWKVMCEVTRMVEDTPLNLSEAFLHFRISILRHLICGYYRFNRGWAEQIKVDSNGMKLDSMQQRVIKAIDNPLYRPLIRIIVLTRKVIGKLKRL